MFRSILIGACLVCSALQARPIQVGLVLGSSGKDDKSFCAAAYEGATAASKKLGIQLKTIEATDDAAIESSLRTFAKRRFDLILAIGFIMGGSLKKVALDFPKTHFAVVDAIVDLPNVRSITFEEQQGSFLVGAIAALTSKTKTVGFIGGMDVPLVRRFEMGYKSGAEAAVPGVQVLSNYIGMSTDAWKNPTKAKELALGQYSRKADVVFHVSGASGAGLFDAAEEAKKYAIGVDSNQNGMKPGFVLTSMIKRVDRAVYETIEQELHHQFKPGHSSLGLAEGGVDYAIDENNRKLLPADVLKKVEAMRSRIVKHELQVPDYYKK